MWRARCSKPFSREYRSHRAGILAVYASRRREPLSGGGRAGQRLGQDRGRFQAAGGIRERFWSLSLTFEIRRWDAGQNRGGLVAPPAGDSARMARADGAMAGDHRKAEGEVSLQ